MAPWLNLLFGCAIVASTGAAQAKSVKPTKAVPGGYIVEFADNHDTDFFYHTLRERNVQFEHRRELNYTLFKGTSFRLHDLETEAAVAEAISGMSGIKKLWPVHVQNAPKVKVHWKGNSPSSSVAEFMKRDYATEKDTFSPHVMTQVDRLRADGVTGQGVRIGVIDTGIDYNHPALGGCFGEGCLVSYGTDYVGDDYDGMNAAVPDPDPDDNCNGHGTHVAGTIAAQTNPLGFTGSAPGVTLGAYRVFGCPFEGSSSDDVFLAAMNQAFEDGSDIISLSLGSDSSWAEEVASMMAARIVEAGTIVVVANGNSGSQGLFLAGSPSTGKGVASVASVENVEAPSVLTNGTYQIGDGAEESFAWTPSDTYRGWGNVTLPLWSASLNTTATNDACEPYDDSTPNLSEYIVLIRRGGCVIRDKVSNAAAAGAQYVMIYNNAIGIDLISGPQIDGIEGVGMTGADQGVKWIEALADGETVELSIVDPFSSEQYIVNVPNTLTGGFPSIFTSWGPNYELDLKPSFSAPGGKILSTWPLALGGYAVISGTSMATPLVAGIYALLINVRGTKDPHTLLNALSSTSSANLFHNGRQAFPYLAPAAQQGNGLVRAYDAAHVTSLLDVSSISFNDTDNFISRVDFSISNTGKEDVTFVINHVRAATAYTLDEDSIFPSLFTTVELTETGADLDFSMVSITIPAGGKETISVSPKAPAGLDEGRLPVYSGYITLNGTNGENLSLPYVGLQGSLHDATILDSEGTYLTRSDDMDAEPIVQNETFTLPAPGGAASEDVVYPVLAISLALGTPAMRIDVVPQDTSVETTDVLGVSTIGTITIDGYEEGFFARLPVVAPWDGSLTGGEVAPAGTYTLVVRALKIFGDASKADEWDQVESVPVTIAYE